MTINFFATLIASFIAFFTSGICSNTSNIVTTSNELSVNDKLVRFSLYTFKLVIPPIFILFNNSNLLGNISIDVIDVFGNSLSNGNKNTPLPLPTSNIELG